MTLLGLADYGSSDDEDEAPIAKGSIAESPAQPQISSNLDPGNNVKRPIATTEAALPTKPGPAPAPAPTPTLGAPQGPALGPQAGPALPSDEDEADLIPEDYEAKRKLMQQLTLPPIPHVEIPPSPPGSPRPSATARITQFLKLKKDGVHFNEKLASSSALKNPTLLQGQLKFAGMSEMEQYATTLPEDLKPVPDGGFPYWAYGDELNRSQERLRKKKEREKGGKVEFVSAKSEATTNGKEGHDAKRRREH